jgi:hypothetical protein
LPLAAEQHHMCRNIFPSDHQQNDHISSTPDQPSQIADDLYKHKVRTRKIKPTIIILYYHYIINDHMVQALTAMLPLSCLKVAEDEKDYSRQQQCMSMPTVNGNSNSQAKHGTRLM